MVGVARSKRCDQCKRRRSKCDECWPVCGSCKKYGQACSGPPTAFAKFIAHESNGTVDAESLAGTDTSQKLIDVFEVAKLNDGNGHTALAAVRQRTAPTGGGLFIRMRQSPPMYSSPSGNGTDAVTRKMTNVLSSVAGTRDDIVLRASWIQLVPSRLSRGSALWHAADLFIRSWTKARQEPADDSNTVLDSKLYSKAISALRKEMHDSDKAFSTETLAAVALVHISEDEFGSQINCHSNGLQMLLNTRGLPNLQDELDVRLAFESIGNLLVHSILGGEPDYLREPTWRQTMKDALGSKSMLDAQTLKSFNLILFLSRWPGLVTRMQRIRTQSEPDVALALDLAADVSDLSRDLLVFDQETLQPLLQDPLQVSVIADQEAVDGHAYMFTNWETCDLLLMHSMVSLAVHQVQLSALHLSGCRAYPMDAYLEELSRRVWMSVQYTLLQASTARLALVAPLVLSLEYALPAEQERLAALVPMLLGKRRAAAWSSCSVPALLAVSRLLTGRSLT